ncbi:MAG: ABC transporter permease [Acidimicrobiales bacterium]
MWDSIKAFVAVQLQQQSRDKTSLFFMLVLPVAIMVIIGSTFGGVQSIEIAVVGPDDPTTAAIVEQLNAQDGIESVRRSDLDEVTGDIRRFDLEGAIVVNGDGTYGFLANDADSSGFAARAAAQRVIDRFEAGVADESAVPVAVSSVGDDRLASQGAFALTAAQNLVLFVFINSLGAAALLVRARQSGVLRRSMSAPVSAAAVGVGIGAGWMALAMVQTLIIMGIGAFAFGVDWGNPLAAAALAVTFGLVGLAGGILLGSVFTSEQTVSSAVPPFALVLAALGGCMVPSEVFPSFLRTASKVTPHYWALEGWKELMFDGASIGAIAPNLGILLGASVVLLVLGAGSLRRAMTAG